MNNSALEHARRYLENGFQELLVSHNETSFAYGVELAVDVIDSSNGAEQATAKNLIFTYLAKIVEATLDHLNDTKQPSDDFLSTVMRMLWLLSEMKLSLNLDFMEVWNQMFSVSIDTGMHAQVNDKQKVMLKDYLERIKEEILNERAE